MQIHALESAGCLRVYTDHGVSGTKAKRPELERLLDNARAGDELVVWKLDRLGRNTRQLLDLVDSLESQGIYFRSLTEGITTTGPMGKAMLTVMSAFAQLERDQLAERTRAGLAAAAARGRKGGRPTVTPDSEKVRQAGQYRHVGLTPPEISKLLGVSRATVYRYLALVTDMVTNKLKVAFLEPVGRPNAPGRRTCRVSHLATHSILYFKLLLSTSNRQFGVLMIDVPGSAQLVLLPDIHYLNEPQAVFNSMLIGWQRQLRSRSLASQTVDGRISLVRRFNEFAGSYPWSWTPGDMEDFTLSLMSGSKKAAPSTIRGYHLMIRMFCDYLLDGRYGWTDECQKRFNQVPSQVCHDYNTVAHTTDYEGHPARRPFTYDEIQHLFDFLDTRVERVKASGRKGAWAALRDAQIVKTVYAYGLRRREACMLDIADLRPNPQMPQWGTYGAVHVRYGKAVRGGVPRRRTVLTVPEFDWVVTGLTQWVEQARPLVLGINADGRVELWPTERRGRIDPRTLDLRFAWLRKEAGLPEELTLHCLRHSYVTHLIEFGYPERFVTEQVGHSYASTTAIYTSVSNDFKTKTLQSALGRVYNSKKGPQ